MTLPRGYRVPPELSSRSAGNRLGGQKYTGPYLLFNKLLLSPCTPFVLYDSCIRSGLSPVAHTDGTRSGCLRNSSEHLRNSSGGDPHAMDRPLLSLFLRHSPCYSGQPPLSSQGDRSLGPVGPPSLRTKASAPTNPAEGPGLMATYTLGDLLLSLRLMPPTRQPSTPLARRPRLITITSTPQGTMARGEGLHSASPPDRLG